MSITLTTAAGLGITGLAGTAGFTVYNADHTSFLARSTVGVLELGTTGNYVASFTGLPDTTYLAVWDDGSGNSTSPDLVRIDSAGSSSTAPTAQQNAAAVVTAMDSTSAKLAYLTGPAALAAQIPAGLTSALFASPGVFAQAALINSPAGGSSGTAPTAQQNATAVAQLMATSPVGTVTDKAGYALSSAGLNAIPIDGANLPQALAIMGAAIAGNATPIGGGQIQYAGINSSTTRVTANTSGGYRTSVVYAGLAQSN